MSNSPFISQNTGKHTLLLLSFLILVIDMAFASFTNISNYIALPILVLWMAFILTSNIKISKNERTFVIVSFLLLMVIVLYWVIRYSQLNVYTFMVNGNWLLLGVISIYVMKLFSARELSRVYFTITIIIFALLFLFIGMGRVLLSVGEQNEAALVTTAWYGSLFMLFSGMSLVFFLHVKTMLPKIIALAIFLLSLYLNFSILQRGTNVLFTIAEMGIILVFLLKRKGLVCFLSIAVLALTLYVYMSGLLVDMFDWLAEIVPSERLASRFKSISFALYYEDIAAGGGSLNARNRLIGVSWDTFTSSFGHFVFGAGEHHGENTIIGHHSFFTDTLARYGIIGGVMVFVYFKKQYQIIMSYLDKNTDWALYMQCAVVFLFYVLRNYYGQLAYALVNLVLLVFFPLTFQLIQFYKNKS